MLNDQYPPLSDKQVTELADGSAVEQVRALAQEVRRLRKSTRVPSEVEYRARIDCLSMFVRRLYRKLRKYEPDAEVIMQANTYLKAIGQAGTPLRIEEASSLETPHA
jgi:hypothetical protein